MQCELLNKLSNSPSFKLASYINYTLIIYIYIYIVQSGEDFPVS